MIDDITNERLKRLLSRKLALLRKKSGQTIEATADSLDMDPSEYYRMLCGKNLPHLLTLLRFSRKYGVTLDWWFDGVEMVPPMAQRQMLRLQSKNLEGQIVLLLRRLDVRFQEVLLDTAKSLVRKTEKIKARL
ncbi:MAG: helix-turn-helix transcriptional regulator [Candidatus Margulisbacteria bacterium]|jgi:transcriptional regulator with XRE-family HTH domain|nr:helix-turn-helix transcriptional regulator [Candidatus Margulisiibacteriota bacterium]